MGNGSFKPVLFSTGKPTPWWQKSSVVSVIVAAVAALAFGLWAYASNTPTAPAVMGAPSSDAAPDAVQMTLSAGKPTIVEFGANNCVSCREMKPVLYALAQDPRIAVADVDILKQREYISRYQIRLMPTQVFYDARGQETGRHMGKISGEEILARLGITDSGDASPVATPKARL
jgi:thioredoxin 1